MVTPMNMVYDDLRIIPDGYFTSEMMRQESVEDDPEDGIS